VEDAKLDAALESPPAEFDEPEELFAKVEDDEIEALNEDLRERVEEGARATTMVTVTRPPRTAKLPPNPSTSNRSKTSASASTTSRDRPASR